MNAPSRHTELHALLDANHEFSLMHSDTTNHCPMALTALAEMGAEPHQLRAFFDFWESERAEPAEATRYDIGWGRWDTAVGRLDAFPALLRVMEERVAACGVEETVREVLGSLPFSPGGGAFHPLIRLAFALRADHDGEAAAGLAYYLSSYLCLPAGLNANAPVASVEDGLASLSRAMGGWNSADDWIHERFDAVLADPRFAAALPGAPKTANWLDALARMALRVYWQTDNFTALHMVTATLALRDVLEHLPGLPAEAWRPALWQTFCVAYVSIGAPALEAEELPEAQPAWPLLLQRVLNVRNEHVIKLVYACQREFQRSGDVFYHAAAARALWDAV
ncbi:questin oxidase family protein [Chromobacterium haemolyticum]|uniref:questin oxidase family protein n=1 Tax=Chromobacterium TaxID=535 RepID=UPI0040566386